MRFQKGQRNRLTHGMRRTPIYGIWNQMIQRCTNPKVKGYDRYGGRGIEVCERWLKFENFFADMGDRPEGHSIERKNNDLGYDPSNCIWIPKDKQAQNRRDTVHIDILGEKLCISEAARRLSVPRSSLARWHKNGDTDRLKALAP